MLTAVTSIRGTPGISSSMHAVNTGEIDSPPQESTSCSDLIRAVEEKDAAALRAFPIFDNSFADQAMKRAIELKFSEGQQVLLEKMPDHDFFDCLEQAMEQADQPNSSLVTKILARISDQALEPKPARVQEWDQCSRNIYLMSLNCNAVKKGETQFLSRIVALHKLNDLYGDNLPKLYEAIPNISQEIEEILLKMDLVFFKALKMAVEKQDEEKITQLLEDPTSRKFPSQFIEILESLWEQESFPCLNQLIGYMRNYVNKIYGIRYIDMFLKKAAQQGNIGKIEMVADLLESFAPKFIAGGWKSSTVKMCIDTGFTSAETSSVLKALCKLRDKVKNLYPGGEVSQPITFVFPGNSRFIHF